jgi:hypothetical protein
MQQRRLRAYKRIQLQLATENHMPKLELLRKRFVPGVGGNNSGADVSRFSLSGVTKQSGFPHCFCRDRHRNHRMYFDNHKAQPSF